MGMFTVNKPRGFQHNYIYYDPRKEKLKKIEENAKREMGLLPPKEFEPEDIRGKFVGATTHLKRRKESGRKPLSYGVLIFAIILLLLLMHYLVTGRFML
ncbi:MAG: hypothetical protein IJ901_03395 [Bacteroidaceae bacterium]|jgi:hypothetical protein|nr:hypothetical protein [Bacteroidaceae bacterium]